MELMWYCHVTQWFHRGLPTKLEIQFMHLVKIDLLLKLLLLILISCQRRTYSRAYGPDS